MNLFSCLSTFKFCSLNSGSNGNSYFVGTDDFGVLVDAGISAVTINSRLKSIGYGIDSIKALFLTHDHIDHIKGVRTLINKYHIPVFAREACLKRFLKYSFLKNIDKRFLNPMGDNINICGINVEAFDIPHDAPGSVGYYLSYDDKNLTIATDIGHIDKTVETYLMKADSIVIESNYDRQMLDDSNYPLDLKQRIAGGYGHLSNDEAAAYVANHYHPDMKNILLCHLSENNNTPKLALQCLYRHFNNKKLKINDITTIIPLSRYQNSPILYL